MRSKSLLLLGFLAFGLGLNAKTELAQLKVEYQQVPLAVEVSRPRFSWQMIADDNLRGWKQTAYEIVVTDEKGRQVWKSGIVKSDRSLNVSYTGEPLAPTTRYVWSLNVWNQKKEKMTASSSFETGLVMRENYNHSGNGNLNVWGDAKWIGRKEGATMFYAPYLPVFRLHYELQFDKKSKSTRAGFIFARLQAFLLAARGGPYGPSECCQRTLRLDVRQNREPMGTERGKYGIFIYHSCQYFRDSRLACKISERREGGWQEGQSPDYPG